MLDSSIAESHCFRGGKGRVQSAIRVLYRALRGVGPWATFQLVRRRLGAAFGEDSSTLYRIRVPGYPQPVAIRGGNSSDGYAFYQILAMKDFDILGDLKPSLMIDAGANIGMSSLYFLNRYPSIRIVAVEPNPETFAICRMNLAPFADRVTLVHGAVWSSCGRVALVREKVEWNSHVVEDKGNSDALVDAYDVPSLIAMGGGGTVDLLKVDIEGGEAEVFGKNPERWMPAVKNIVIEFHGDQCEKNFFSALEPYRYESFPYRTVTVCRNLQPRPAETVSR
jgi:FkbM family methyltransferase